MIYKLFIYFFAPLLLFGCKNTYLVSEILSDTIKVSGMADTLSDAYKLVAPYKTEYITKMSDTIAFNPFEMKKGKPESLLGNWCGDAIKWYADSILLKRVDFAICNYGGLRIHALPKGDISLGKMYELMPFDNTVALIAIDSTDLDSVLQKITENGGWPVSSGIQIKMSSDGKLVSWKVNKISDSKKYIIATNNYIANGGDKMTVLKRLKKENYPDLLRNIFIRYAKHQKTLHATLENRISINGK